MDKTNILLDFDDVSDELYHSKEPTYYSFDWLTIKSVVYDTFKDSESYKLTDSLYESDYQIEIGIQGSKRIDTIVMDKNESRLKLVDYDKYPSPDKILERLFHLLDIVEHYNRHP